VPAGTGCPACSGRFLAELKHMICQRGAATRRQGTARPGYRL